MYFYLIPPILNFPHWTSTKPTFSFSFRIPICFFFFFFVMFTELVLIWQYELVIHCHAQSRIARFISLHTCVHIYTRLMYLLLQKDCESIPHPSILPLLKLIGKKKSLSTQLHTSIVLFVRIFK